MTLYMVIQENDTIDGGAGDDTIYGGSGLDYLFGDIGDDIWLPI